MKKRAIILGSLVLAVVSILVHSSREAKVAGAGAPAADAAKRERGEKGAGEAGMPGNSAEGKEGGTSPGGDADGATVGRTASSAEAAAARETYARETDPAVRLSKGAGYVERYARSNPREATEVFRGMVTDDLLAAADVVEIPSGPGEGVIEEVRLRREDYDAVADSFQQLSEDVPDLSGEVLDGVTEEIGFDLVNRWLSTVADANPVAVTDFIRALPEDYQGHALWGVAEIWGTVHGLDYATSNLNAVADITRTEGVEALVVRAVEDPRWR